MDIFLSVPAYLCNIALLAALFSLPFMRLLHWMEGWRPITRRGVLLPVALLLCLSMAFQGFIFAGLAVPATIGAPYTAYRPWVLMEAIGHIACDR